MTQDELKDALRGLPNLRVVTYSNGMATILIMDGEKTLHAMWLPLSSIRKVSMTDKGALYIFGENGPLAAFHKDLLALAGGAK